MNLSKITKILVEKGLKVTPQRIAVMEALSHKKDHPTAECIIDFVRKNHPNIAVGTVYKTLETFVEKKIINKVKTDRDIMRYDIETHKHHHLYCDECEHIENYYDDELDELLRDYFNKKKIPDFNIREINLQIVGSYPNHKPK
jgi:Fur family transcriptional regulator, peroxide stress response regulator